MFWVFVVFRFEDRVPVDYLEVDFLLVRYVLVLLSFFLVFSALFVYTHFCLLAFLDRVPLFFFSPVLATVDLSQSAVVSAVRLVCP